MFYIWNTHLASHQNRKAEELRREVKDLKSKYLMRESTLRAGTRFSEIKGIVDSMGLRHSSAPPYKLVISKDGEIRSEVNLARIK